MAKNLLLLIFFALLLQADAEFIFSYKLCVENAQAVNEQIYISRAMTITNTQTKFVCKINKKLKKNETILKYLRNNKQSLLKCFQKNTKYINSFYEGNLKNSYSQITIKMAPIRFTVKFNNDFAIINTFKTSAK